MWAFALKCFRGRPGAEGVGVLHRVAAPAGRRGPPAPPREPHRLQAQAPKPLHQARAGPEGAGRPRQPQATHTAVMMTKKIDLETLPVFVVMNRWFAIDVLSFLKMHIDAAQCRNRVTK